MVQKLNIQVNSTFVREVLGMNEQSFINILSAEDNKHFFIKDCSLAFLLKHRPQLKTFLDSIALLIELKKIQYKYITFDYQELFAGQTTKSCKNINWHTDGPDNEYLLIAWGNKRTEFQELPQLEVENGNLYQYDSSDVHRGRLLDKGECRVFLRICFSNQVKPNNKIMFNLN